MSNRSAASRALHGWPTRRFELMQTRVCDLRLSLAGSVYRGTIERVKRDLARRGLHWFPRVYLSTGWHCPDRVPVVGVPFTLATRELRRLEKELTNELESPMQMVRLLRHELGHAYLYALRLHETREWKDIFGPISRPYREQYVIRPNSRQFVRHLERHYAQKHPDEDFAETFATWLTPRARWKREYQGWGALRKLEYVDDVMGDLRGWSLDAVSGPEVEPVEELRYTVAQFYRYAGYRLNDQDMQDEAVAYVDEDLRAVFSGRRIGGRVPGHRALRRLRRQIVSHVVQLLNVRTGAANDLYDKYVERAGELGVEVGQAAERRLLVGVTTMMTTHLLNRAQTGRFTVQHRLLSCK